MQLNNDYYVTNSSSEYPAERNFMYNVTNISNNGEHLPGNYNFSCNVTSSSISGNKVKIITKYNDSKVYTLHPKYASDNCNYNDIIDVINN